METGLYSCSIYALSIGFVVFLLCAGQWWYKRAMYIQKGEPIGCHGWPSCFKEIGFAEPYNMAMAHILKGSLSVPGFNGTTVYRSFAPDHFEGGEWDTGGACPRTVPGGVPMNYLAKWMYDIQIQQFRNVTGQSPVPFVVFIPSNPRSLYPSSM